jgi:hypothetical protein
MKYLKPPKVTMGRKIASGLSIPVCAGLLAIAGMLVGASPAFAGDPLVESVVTPLPPIVTYSRPTAEPPLLTYAAYEVTVTNNSKNVLNNVRLQGTTSVTGIGVTAIARFDSSVGLACLPVEPLRTTINCTIGQLRSEGGSASFVVIFEAPAVGEGIKFNWDAYYSEGSNDSGAHLDQNTGEAFTSLGTPIDTYVSSYVLPNGTVYTGGTGIATPLDPWTTTVTVSSTAKAEITESKVSVSCSPNPEYCLVSALNIPGTFTSMLITLRRDATTIVKGAKIANVVVYYDPNLSGTSLGIPIIPCNFVGLTPSIPSGEHRCIVGRTEYTKKTAPTPEYEGDWEIRILADSNGRNAW